MQKIIFYSSVLISLALFVGCGPSKLSESEEIVPQTINTSSGSGTMTNGI